MLFEDGPTFTAGEKRIMVAGFIVAAVLVCWGLYEVGSWVAGLF